MIREMQAGDIGRVMEIWLMENTEAHRFIDAQYWKGHFEMVREMLPQAKVYVSQDGGCVNAFIGLNLSLIHIFSALYSARVSELS